VDGVELLLEAGRVSEPLLTVVCAQRRGTATVSHLGAVPHRVSSRVRTTSTPCHFAKETPCRRALDSLGAKVR
jgi:hypothetical protein